MTAGELLREISSLSRDIQDVENELIRLQLKRDELVQKREALRKKRKKLETKQDIRNAEITLKMTMDMFGKEVGIDDLVDK